MATHSVQSVTVETTTTVTMTTQTVQSVGVEGTGIGSKAFVDMQATAAKEILELATKNTNNALRTKCNVDILRIKHAVEFIAKIDERTKEDVVAEIDKRRIENNVITKTNTRARLQFALKSSAKSTRREKSLRRIRTGMLKKMTTPSTLRTSMEAGNEETDDGITTTAIPTSKSDQGARQTLALTTLEAHEVWCSLSPDPCGRRFCTAKKALSVWFEE